jgi:Rhodopirellula transposase DDE domain
MLQAKWDRATDLAQVAEAGLTSTSGSSIRRWWRARGAANHPGATRLLITADAGGSDSFRYRAVEGRSLLARSNAWPPNSASRPPPGSVATKPPTMPGPDTALLGVVLYAARRDPHVHDLGIAFGWTLDRLHAAVRDLDRLLTPQGMRVTRSDGLVRLRANMDTDALNPADALTQLEAGRTGLAVDQAQLARFPPGAGPVGVVWATSCSSGAEAPLVRGIPTTCLWWGSRQTDRSRLGSSTNADARAVDTLDVQQRRRVLPRVAPDDEEVGVVAARDAPLALADAASRRGGSRRGGQRVVEGNAAVGQRDHAAWQNVMRLGGTHAGVGPAHDRDAETDQLDDRGEDRSPVDGRPRAAAWHLGVARESRRPRSRSLPCAGRPSSRRRRRRR